jgi:fucose permease
MVLLLTTILMSSLVVGLLLALPMNWPALFDSTADTKKGSLSIWFYSAFLPALPLGGWAVDHWKDSHALFIALLLVSIGLATLAMRAPSQSPALALLLLGIGSAWATSSCVALMSHMDNKSPAAAVNLGFLGIGMGGLLLPTCVGKIRDRLGARRGIFVVAFLPLVAALLSSLVNWPEAVFAQAGNSFWTNPAVWLAALASLLYFPLEGSLSVWTSSLLKELGHDPKQITRWLFGFWATFLAARLAAGFFIAHVQALWILLLLILLCGIIQGNLAGAYSWTTSWALLLLGATHGPILPTFLGEVAGNVVPEHAGLAIAIVFLVGTTSDIVARPVMNRFASHHTVRATLRIPMILAFIMAAPVLLLALLAGR